MLPSTVFLRHDSFQPSSFTVQPEQNPSSLSDSPRTRSSSTVGPEDDGFTASVIIVAPVVSGKDIGASQLIGVH
jgi:hypothetical protein